MDEANDLDEGDECADITIVKAISLLGDDLEHEGIAEFIQPVMELDLRLQGMLV